MCNMNRKQKRNKRVKHIKMLTSWMLVLLFIIGSLSGCGKSAPEGGTNAKEAAKGRFLEEEISLPEKTGYVEMAGVLSDGTFRLLALSENNEKRIMYESKDKGSTWEEITLPEQLKLENCEYIDKAVMAPSGDFFVVGSFVDSTDGYGYWSFDKEGNGKKLKISLPKVKEDGTYDNFVTDASFTDNGNLYVSDLNWQAYQIDLSSGDILKNIGKNGDVSILEHSGNDLIMVNDNGVKMYNAETEKEEEADSVLSDTLNGQKTNTNVSGEKDFVFSEGKDGIFFASHEGIFFHSIGGSAVEQVVNGELNSMGNPNIGLKNLWYLDTNEFVLFCIDEQGKNIMLKYSYAEDVSTVPEKELKVYALNDSSDIHQVITAFQKKNPDTYVNLIIGKTSDNAVTTDDALRTLNSDIMAGKGPDILILDGMPVDSYMEKGLLLDISDICELIEKEDGLFNNITDTYSKDGKIYGIPSRFLFSFVQGKADAVKAGSSLKDLASYVDGLDKNTKENHFTNMDAETTLKELFHADSSNWIQNSKIDQNGMTEFFKSAKKLYNSNKNKENEISLKNITDVLSIGVSACMDVMTDIIDVNIGSVDSYYGMSMLYSSNQSAKNGALKCDLFNHAGKNIFMPILSLGINSKSENTEAAKQFVEVAMSKEVGAVSGYGLPVNRSSFEQMCKKGENDTAEGSIVSTNATGEMVSLNLNPLTNEEMKQVTSMIESLDTASVNDSVIRDLVIEQGTKYLEGSQSEEDSVKNVMQKVELYLSE